MRSIAVEHTLTLDAKVQRVSPSQSLNPPPRYDHSDYPEEYPVKDLRGHRKAKGGGIELLVRWHGKNKETNKPWDDSFEPEVGVADDLIDEYFARVRSVESKVVPRVDVRPLFHLARRSLAHAVCLDITRAEPMEHDVPIDALSLEALAIPFLEMVAARAGGLAIDTHYDSDGTMNKQVALKKMARIADFCVFEHLVDGAKAYGAMRYDIGRTTNKEISVVGPPLVFTASFNRKLDGVVSFSVRFPTVRINGASGGPTPPQLPTSHMLKRASVMDQVVQYVKDNLPSTHGLVGKGWTALPAMQWEVDDDVAVEA